MKEYTEKFTKNHNKNNINDVTKNIIESQLIMK